MKKKVKLDMTQIKEALQKLSFLKSYSFLLLPAIIVVVAILVYIPIPMMNSSLQSKIEKESVRKGKSLANLGKAVVSKDQWIQEQKMSDAYLSDVNEASELALQSSQRELLSYDIFPLPKESSVTIFKQFGQIFHAKLEDFVKAAGGGDRPTNIELGLSNTSGGFSRDNRNVRRSSGKISDSVVNALCFKRAQSVSFYVNIYDLMFYNFWSVNSSGTMRQQQEKSFEYSGVDAAVEDCWYTQSGYWILEDVIATIKAVNGSSTSVYTSAVKRLIDFNFGLSSTDSEVLPEYVIAPEDADNFRRGAKTGPMTLTGRTSKDGIDVVYFNMLLAIDSSKMMEFMKELGRAKKHTFMGFDGKSEKQNFKHNQITILDADFEIVDRNTAGNKYYRYGDAAVVELALSCEYIFNKKGYFDIKPDTIKTLLKEQFESGNFEEQEEEDSGMNMMGRPPARSRRSR